MGLWKRALALAFVVGLSGQAFGLSLVSSPGGFVANDTTNFSTVAGFSLAQPVAYTTPGGLGLTLSSSNAASTITIDPSPTFSRDFLPNQLQVASSNSDTLEITFGQAIRGVATQITHPHQGPYLARITAYDIGNNVLGTFDLTEFENNSGDASALWIGVQDAVPTIKRISLQTFEGTTETTNPSNQDVALITDLQLLTGNAPGNPPPTGAIPEPAGLGLLALAVGALGWRMRRR
jgi:hypothetical protein